MTEIDDDGGSCAVGPWLSDRQQVVWRRWLAMWRMVDARIERDMQQYGGMPFAYYLVLAMLSEAPDRQLRMNRLSEIVGFSQSRLSHAVARLEDLGWVRRDQAEGDRRGQIATLTDAGFERLDKVAPLHAETVRATLFDPLTDDQLGELERIFDAVLDNEPDYEQRLRQIDPWA
jgi:DNA-binding MarR family transcriptional regulator